MKTFLQTVEDALAEARRTAAENGGDTDRECLRDHLAQVGRRVGGEWWRTLEDKAYTGADVPLSAWRSAIREYAPSGFGLLSRWIRARPARCPDALKAAAMAQELKNEAN